MAGLQEYKCPACGGGLEFNSTVQKMKCPFCDSEYELDELKQQDEALEQPQEAAQADEDGMYIYVCQSCGGEVVGDADTGAAACPFCGNPVVMTGSFAGNLKPDSIIPFKLDKKAAKEALQKHLLGKRLLPKAFKDENHIDEIKGIYVPFWLFDADSDGVVRFEATRVRHWSDKDYDYRETSYYDVLRAGSLGFDGVPVKATDKMASDLMESLEPYDTSAAVPFRTAYLAGYLADKYNVSPEESSDRVKERAKNATVEEFRSTVHGFNTVSLRTAELETQLAPAHYTLYPVWLLHTTWNGEKYTFAMNGQTGKFVGDLPMDKGAFWRWFGLVGVIGAAVTYAIGLLIHLL